MSSIKNQTITFFNEGNVFYKSKNYEKALASYEATLDQDTTFVHAYLWKAKTLIQLGRYDEGVSSFLKERHRYRDSKLESYALQILHLLLEKGEPQKAKELVASLELDLKENHFKEHLRLLFIIGKYREGIHDLLQLPITQMTHEYTAVMKGSLIPESARETLTKGNILPRYVSARKQLQLISKLQVQHKELITNLSEVHAILETIKSGQKKDYVPRLTEVESILDNCKALVLEHGKLLLKTNQLKVANTVYETLKVCNYDKEVVTSFEKAIRQKEQLKTKKQTKYVFIGSAIAIVLAIVGYYAVLSFQKSSRYKEAIASNNLSTYTSYLEQYGDDNEIHRLRELKLYNIAIETNHSNAINSLTNLYPKSKYLKTISLHFKDGLQPDYRIFGIASPEQIINHQNNSFQCPVGATIGLSIEEPNKVPINKYFTVSSDMTITEAMQDRETLLFEENFNTNTRGWATFKHSKQVYGTTKYKGAKVSSGNLELYHEFNDGKFVMSSIYLGKLKRQMDFKIVVTWKRNVNDNGTFLLFGATKRAFNYVGFNKSRYLYGYNNWDNSNQNWIKESNGWQYSNIINNNDYGANTLEVKKELNNLEYRVNGSLIGATTLKKWYGNRLGFGVNDNTQSFIQQVKIYEIRSYIPPEFTKDQVYFCSVKELNVREGSITKAKIRTTIKQGVPIKYLGIRGKKKINATLNDVFSPDYYYQVELLDGSKGWVHGGGLSSLNTKEKLTMDGFRIIQKSNSISIN